MEDARYGYTPGVRLFPEAAGLSAPAFQRYLERAPPGHRTAEGMLPGAWDGKSPRHVWRALDATYDQCVGNCECLPGRDSEWRGAELCASARARVWTGQQTSGLARGVLRVPG